MCIYLCLLLSFEQMTSNIRYELEVIQRNSWYQHRQNLEVHFNWTVDCFVLVLLWFVLNQRNSFDGTRFWSHYKLFTKLFRQSTRDSRFYRQYTQLIENGTITSINIGQSDDSFDQHTIWCGWFSVWEWPWIEKNSHSRTNARWFNHFISSAGNLKIFALTHRHRLIGSFISFSPWVNAQLIIKTHSHFL